FAFEKIDPHVHFEEREPHLEPCLHSPRILGSVARNRGISIEPHPVAVSTSEHLINGDLERLPGEVPERHLHAANAAALAAVVAELLDLLEQALDVAGVLAQKPALEHERIARAAAVSDLA